MLSRVVVVRLVLPPPQPRVVGVGFDQLVKGFVCRRAWGGLALAASSCVRFGV